MKIEKKYFVLSKNLYGNGNIIVVPNQGFQYNHDKVVENNIDRFKPDGSAFTSWSKYGIYSTTNGYPKWAKNEISSFDFNKTQFDFFKKVRYSQLNSKQKENYNFHKVASSLADYGYNCIWLNDDWQGSDFIAIHISGENFLKIQLKGRFSVDKKYLGKDIWISFIENEEIKIYNHDTVVKKLSDNILKSKSWHESGSYGWNQTPAKYEDFIFKL
tara:strand:- start:4791 stop:5435 length:645 start_codon:yes stop_codon:yes gene_type:complete